MKNNSCVIAPTPNLRGLASLLLTIVIALCVNLGHAATTHVWSGAGGNGLFSNPANWSSGGAPVAGSTVILQFPASGTTQAVVNVSNLLADSLTITRTQFTLAGTGYPMTVKNVTVASNSTVTFAESLPLEVYATVCHMSHLSNSTVRLQSPLRGTGKLMLTGFGQFLIGGSLANSNTGLTEIIGVAVRMAKPVGVNAFGGDVLVRSGANLYWDAHQQLPNTGTTLTVDNYQGNDTAVWIGHSESLDTLRLVADPGTFYPWDTDFSLGFGLLTLRRLELFGTRRIYDAQISISQALAATNCGLGVQFDAPLSLISSAQGVSVQLDDSYTDFNAPISGPTNASIRFQTTSGLGNNCTARLRATNTFLGKAFIDRGTVETYNEKSLGATNGETVIGESGTLVIATNMTLAEPLVMIGSTNSPDEAFFYVTATVRVPDYQPATATLAGAIVVSNHVEFSTYDPGASLLVSGSISGPGRIQKWGQGTVRFIGSQPNTFSGGFDVRSGIMDLQRAPNVAALPGPVTVHISGTLRSAANHQIADTASVFLSDGGVWDLQSYSETVRNLDFSYAGTVNGFGGALQVNSTISAHDLGAYATINAPLALGVNGTTVDVSDAPSSIPLRFTGNVSGGFSPSLTKTGSGRLELWGANSYLGDTFVESGTLAMKNALALGGTVVGTTVSGGGVLEIGVASSIHNEWLSLNDGVLRVNASGTNTWGGVISVNGISWIETAFANSKWILTNAINGGGDLAKTGPGALEIGGSVPNTYAGFTWVAAGTLFLNKINGPAVPGAGLAIGFEPPTFTEGTATVNSLGAGQVGDSTVVGLGNAATWNLNNFSDAIGALAGAGQIHLGNATLTHGSLGTDTTFSGQITGTGSISIQKQGAGTFTMTGNNPYSGRTSIVGGKVVVNGTNGTGLVTLVPGATLGGTGQVANISVTGGTVSPGNSPGRLKTGNLNWNQFLTYRCEMSGTNAGVNYDQLSVAGTVSLAGAKLQLVMSFAGAVSNRYTIIANDGTDAITGTFEGLPEGATFFGGGAQFRVSYVGGTGNDVVLTQLAPVLGPQLGAVTRLPDGQIQLTGMGIPEQTYEVHASTNLNTATWINLGAVSADNAGLLQFIDSDAVNHPMRFYRFMLLP